jgi:hypothetical protein
LAIAAAVPLPQPNPRQLAVQLQGKADRLRLRIYSQSWVQVGEAGAGASEAGWVRVDLGAVSGSLVPGIYYYYLEAFRGAAASQAVKGILVFLP